MTQQLFILLLAVPLAGYLFWGITVLPRERWQIFAAVPVRKMNGEQWNGVNLTWYGILTANAYAVAAALLFILLGSARVPLTGTAAMAAILLSFCVPASRLVARVVEKKAHTFTVGGAVFVGVVLAPWIVLLVNRVIGQSMGFAIPFGAALAALAIAYAFGEGLGRLACISFGCCYGRPLVGSPSWLWRLFSGRCFTFSGKTRKIAYAGGLEGEKVLPVQALTAVIYVGCGLASIILYLHSRFADAFIMTMVVTQGWRFLSELLRADYRGGGKVSAYQVMGIAAILYGSGAILLAPGTAVSTPDIAAGLLTLWHPAPLIFLQCVWVAIFYYTGRSSVTGATLSFHVHQDRI
jgi:hypothetical protein